MLICLVHTPNGRVYAGFCEVSPKLIPRTTFGLWASELAFGKSSCGERDTVKWRSWTCPVPLWKWACVGTQHEDSTLFIFLSCYISAVTKLTSFLVPQLPPPPPRILSQVHLRKFPCQSLKQLFFYLFFFFKKSTGACFKNKFTWKHATISLYIDKRVPQ